MGFGIFLLLVGVTLLLINFGVINWSIFDALYDFWPALLIVIGVNMIFRHNEIVRAITWLLFFAALIAYSFYYKGKPQNFPKGSDWANGRGIRIEQRADRFGFGSKYEIGDGYVSVGGSAVRE